jgi:hypothetical protein
MGGGVFTTTEQPVDPGAQHETLQTTQSLEAMSAAPPGEDRIPEERTQPEVVNQI